MKKMTLIALVMFTSLSAQARVKQILFCADDMTEVRITTMGFEAGQYNVNIKNLRNGQTQSYSTRLDVTSFVSDKSGEPTINTDLTSIAFVKSGMGLVILSDCLFAK